MQPIVDGLQAIYDNKVMFVSLNAKDGDVGEAVFQSLSLPGHPSIVMYTIDGTEVYRRFGIVDELTLIDAIENIVELEE